MDNPGIKILNTFLRRLTNLTGNNRSLLLLRLSSEQLMDLHQLSQLLGEKSFTIIEALMAGKARNICPLLDSRMEAANIASRQLKKLARADNTIFEERGAKDLHVGWPIIRGKFSDGTMVRCPLLFFPVSLEQEKEMWKLVPRKDAGVTFNKSFLLGYAYYNKVQLSEELMDFSFDDFDADSTIFRTQLYQAINGKVELNFNRENFGDELVSFEEFKKKEFDETQRQGELKMFPEAVLGIFPQSGSQLVPDYMTMIEGNRFKDLEEFFVSRSKTPEGNAHWSALEEEKIYTPFRMDIYQENAIRLAKTGTSLVVQGPPGTGKSQLICNLMTDAIASGKRALLVCQKKVALDVVYNRLKAMELGDFLGLVHDFRNDRKQVYEKIARQIENVESHRAQNRSVDVIHLERRFKQVARKIDALMEELEEFRKWLFDESECGLSAKELYMTSDPHAETINIKQEYRDFDFRTIQDTIGRINTYVKYAEQLEIESHHWFNRKSFAGHTLQSLKDIEAIMGEIPGFVKKIQAELTAYVTKQLDIEDCIALHGRQPIAEQMIGHLKTQAIYKDFVHMTGYKDDETSLLWLQNQERVCMNCFDGAGVESSLTNAQLGDCQKALNDRMKARRSIIKLVRWELFSEHKFFLKRVLINNDLFYNKHGLQTLEERIDNRQNLEHHLTALKQKPWLTGLPTGYHKKELKEWFQLKINAVRAKVAYSSLRELSRGIQLEKLSVEDFIETIRSLFAIVGTIPFKVDDWKRYLTPYQVRQFAGKPDLIPPALEALRKDFDLLCEYDRVRDSLPDHEKTTIAKLHEVTGSWTSEEMIDIFLNSMRLAWIDHLEMKHPVLRSASTHHLDEMQEELLGLVAEKRQLSKEITLLRARERTYESIEYNRLNNPVTYRDLLHQVTKKRKIWPIRKVISEQGSELFNVIPCWLASPESVSAIFPMEELFDVVIFDEASQCFSERGLPAMYRGKQVIVAGDDKQLKPFELYQVRWDDEDQHPDEEVDSLLDLTRRYLPTSMLQGHYRSVSHQLIEFSNRFFYEGKLKLLPDYSVFSSKEPYIQFEKVDGIWQDQTNPVEAQRLIELIRELTRDNPGKEIGVVTFNAPQQELIQDMIDAQVLDGKRFPETLFIKNIENVQGDEKDIIIFSIGYAKDEKGKMNMQFGSLNVAGGENRLNVAVTRARERVVIVSSIWPEEMTTDHLKNEGPKLLKQYLEYARDVSEGKFKYTEISQNHHASTWYLNASISEWFNRTYPLYNLISGGLPFASSILAKDRHYLGALLLDDEKYATAVSVKEHHAYIPEVLERKHWRYNFVYSRRWWSNREETQEKLVKFIYQADAASRES